MDEIIKNYLDQIKIGGKQVYKNLALFPLLSNLAIPLEYLTLDEALAGGLVEVTAMLSAHKRGVNVQVIMDKSQRGEKNTSANFLANVGIPTFIDDRHGLAHNKIMIIDRETVITGSYNFSRSAEERNAENILIIKSKDLAWPYIDNWNQHKRHSEQYQSRY